MNDNNPYAPPKADLELKPPVVPYMPMAAFVNTGPVGLGGWLILVGIGLVLGPLRQIVVLFTTFMPIFTNGTWDRLTNPASDKYMPAFGPFLISELVVNLLFIAAMIAAAYHFFIKSRRFPKMYIALMSINLVFIIGDAFVGKAVMNLDKAFDGATAVELGRSLVAAVVWIPYMLFSDRVSNTFVE
jgi:hypothetical protein